MRLSSCFRCWLLLLAAGPLMALWAAAPPAARDEVMIRARLTALAGKPVPVRIHWRYGGEGLGGDVVRGELTAVLPKLEVQPGAEPDDDALVLDENAGKPTDRIIQKGDTYNYHYLHLNAWSPWQPLRSISPNGGRRFVTFTLTGLEEKAPLRGGTLEVELAFAGKSLKTIVIHGPDGPTFGALLPAREANDPAPPGADFTDRFLSLRDYVQTKVDHLRAQPGADRPQPRLYGILTDCGGLGTGAGYGIRTTDPETMWTELEALRLMGFNSLRAAPPGLYEQMVANQPPGNQFRRMIETHTVGFPIPTIDVADGRPPTRHPGDGCPHDPANYANTDQLAASAAKEAFELGQKLGVDTVWGLTVDEIGSVYGRASEGRAHMGCCPHCRKAFRAMVEADGRTPADFGAPDWEAIRATDGYWSYDYYASHRMLSDAIKAAEEKVKEEIAKTQDTLKPAVPDIQLDEAAAPKADPSAELAKLKERMEKLIWKSDILEVPEAERKLQVSPTGWRLLQYYTRRFNAESSGQVFAPVARAFDQYNAARRAALARGETDTPAATQPWVYSFALRGNTFLMGGHSLGFFDFYKYADNAMVYETSNRDPRVWQWDSYLCDVGRALQLHRQKAFGIYVKPHRGADTQRALAAIARGARMIFWYTYGPEWKKGDTWGGNLDILAQVAQANRLIAVGEEITYDSRWAHPAEIAVVRPRTSEFLGNAAAWENGKWVYTALQHAHLPVDALDEDLLLELDLKPYRAIVVSGSHLHHRVADKLKAWVAAGGTLYTTAGGLARDEADSPLTALDEVFGVAGRTPVEEWGTVSRYGATRLAPIGRASDPPATAALTGRAPFSGSFTPAVGREVLQPLPAAEVLATWADGAPAALRHGYGKGQAWLIGTYAGLEYAADIMGDRAATTYDAAKRLYVAAPVLAAGARPAADAQDAPLVESILLQHQHSPRQAAVLINWGPARTDLRVRLRTAATTARSGALAQPLTATRLDAEWLEVLLPTLGEGDIVLLE